MFPMCIADCFCVLQCGAVCFCVLQCVAVCCSVLQYVDVFFLAASLYFLASPGHKSRHTLEDGIEDADAQTHRHTDTNTDTDMNIYTYTHSAQRYETLPYTACIIWFIDCRGSAAIIWFIDCRGSAACQAASELLGQFQSKSPMISDSFATRDLQLEASRASSPPCTLIWEFKCIIHVEHDVCQGNTLQHTIAHCNTQR